MHNGAPLGSWARLRSRPPVTPREARQPRQACRWWSPGPSAPTPTWGYPADGWRGFCSGWTPRQSWDSGLRCWVSTEKNEKYSGNTALLGSQYPPTPQTGASFIPQNHWMTPTAPMLTRPRPPRGASADAARPRQARAFFEESSLGPPGPPSHHKGWFRLAGGMGRGSQDSHLWTTRKPA